MSAALDTKPPQFIEDDGTYIRAPVRRQPSVGPRTTVGTYNKRVTDLNELSNNTLPQLPTITEKNSDMLVSDVMTPKNIHITDV